MTTIPNDVRFSDDHEWIRKKESSVGVIGISDYAQHSLGDIVFVELPEIGRVLTKGETFGVIESVKAASDLYAPVSGEVVAIHSEINSNPESVNKDPYGEGWMIEIRMSSAQEFDQLMDAKAYDEHLKKLEQE